MFICVKNGFKEREYLKLKWNKIKNYTNENLPCKCVNQCSCFRLDVDPIELHFFLKELLNFNWFRKFLIYSKYFNDKILYLAVIQVEKQPLDYKWNEMVSYTVWEKVELDNLISWLSTLGGGYSALGDSFTRHAKTAGQISLQQLTLGLQMGDPFLQSRCKLYYSISLIQTGKLRAAKTIIREQYKFARKLKEIDHRLVKMCEGIWFKLEYAYILRKQNNSLKQQQEKLCIENL